jgi:hypothetical protein
MSDGRNQTMEPLLPLLLGREESSGRIWSRKLMVNFDDIGPSIVELHETCHDLLV